ncbi:MAG: hypothetical protein NTV89_11705 [Proteobacteria bacterium]|nr:hypothetical protein [Pseudomonadota bacterium]
MALIERRSRLSPITRACSEGLLYEEPYNGDTMRVDKGGATTMLNIMSATPRLLFWLKK